MVTKSKSHQPAKPLRNVTGFAKWEMPAIDAPAEKIFRQPVEEPVEEEIISVEKISEDALNQIKEQAYKEGFEKGKREGLASAESEIKEKTDLLEGMLSQLIEPVQACGEKTQQELLELAFAVSRQIVRRELKQDPTQLIAIIRDALKLLPIGSKNIQVLLHPDDATIVRQLLSIHSDSPDSRWQLVEEPSMERGGCLLKTDNSNVDASVDRQIAVLFSRIAGGQRAGEDDANG
ncbi:MAG: flagellar assembly protein FliH [Kangiellaceae bacterium]|nr:flagellar assembly protein FliH [Kangiellaceae bacterium]